MSIVVCPICGKELNVDGRIASCEDRHSFDRAREGYFYLLPPNAKGSASPGDNRDMVAARRLFLETDSYLPLASKLGELINERFEGGVTLLDAGVGTGYYLSKIEGARGGKDISVGVDISKEATRAAARANPNSLCLVASVFDLPIASESADVALSVFSPFAEEELARVLKRGGLLYAVVPAERHLIELRRALYDEVRPVESELKFSRFAELRREELSFCFEAEGEAISALLAMTPYAYRAPRDKIQAVKGMRHMKFTADFKIYICEKI